MHDLSDKDLEKLAEQLAKHARKLRVRGPDAEMLAKDAISTMWEQANKNPDKPIRHPSDYGRTVVANAVKQRARSKQAESRRNECLARRALQSTDARDTEAELRELSKRPSTARARRGN